MFALGGSLLLEEEEEEKERGKGAGEGNEEEKGGGGGGGDGKVEAKSWTRKFEETISLHIMFRTFNCFNLGKLSLTYREMEKAACLFPFGF